VVDGARDGVPPSTANFSQFLGFFMHFCQCHDCGWIGPDDECSVGVPADIWEYGDNVPGGGDLEYYEHSAELCPECSSEVNHLSD
jgi:hypothetical protein